MPANAPFFTVAVPVYNGIAFVRKAIDSILAQSFQDWELIVIDNQSTDGTWELLQQFYAEHPKIRLLRNATNLGINGNLARCTTEAAGEWVAILAADDSYVTHALETAHREIGLRPSLVLWVHGELIFHESYVRIQSVYTDATMFSAPQMAEIIYKKGNVFGPISNFIFKRSCAVSKGLNFTDGTQTVDGRFWVRFLQANPEGTAICWPDALSHVLFHKETYSIIYWREGHVIVDFFGFIEVLSTLGWKQSVIVYQMARVVKSWVKFRQHLPKGSRLLPLKVLRTLGSLLFANA